MMQLAPRLIITLLCLMLPFIHHAQTWINGYQTEFLFKEEKLCGQVKSITETSVLLNDTELHNKNAPFDWQTNTEFYKDGTKAKSIDIDYAIFKKKMQSIHYYLYDKARKLIEDVQKNVIAKGDTGTLYRMYKYDIYGNKVEEIPSDSLILGTDTGITTALAE